MNLFTFLATKHKKFNDFKLGLITDDMRSPFIKFIRYHKRLTFTKLRDFQLLKDYQIAEIIKTIDDTTCFITSRIAGLGKSRYASQRAK